MKTRSRSTTSNFSAGAKKVDQYSYPSGVFIETSTVASSTGTYASITEVITDEEPRRKSSGFCKHERSRAALLPYDGTFGFIEGRRYVYTYGGHYLAKEILSPRIALLTDKLAVDSIDWGNLSFTAMRHMRPTLNSGSLDLVNFIRELPHPKHMLRKWRKWISEIRSDGFKRFLEWRWNQLRNNRNKWARKAANANLWYQFGLRPFIQDCVQLMENLILLEGKVRQLVLDEGKLRIRHYSQSLTNVVKLRNDGAEVEVYWADAYKNQLNRKDEWLRRPVYHATVSYRADVSELKGFMGQIRGYISAFGLDRITATIWEAIPFSFLVDWFVDVGGFLDSIDETLFGALPILVSDFSHSVKFEYQTTITWKCWVTQSLPGSTPKVFAQSPIGIHSVKYYERRANGEYPTLVDLQSARSLTLNKISLAASLVVSKKG